MKPKTLKFLQDFVGKVCTIIVPAINRQFDENTSRDYYVCLVQEINDDGIFGTHPYTQKASFYSINFIISIHEEMVLSKEDASKIEKETGQKIESDLRNPFDLTSNPTEQMVIESETTINGRNAFVDVKDLSKIAQAAKNQYENL